MLVVSADQTTYRMHKGMKQIAVSNHEEKYIRQKKPIKTDYLSMTIQFCFVCGQTLLVKTGLNNLILSSFDKIYSHRLKNVNYYFT